MIKKFIYQDEKSSKFWNIETNGKNFTVTFGKIGTGGQTQTKEFDNDEECNKEAEKLIKEKLKKGYVENPEKTKIQGKIKVLKPIEIQELEQHYSFVLKETKNNKAIMGWKNDHIYLLDDNDKIIGLNIRGDKITDIQPLKKFKDLQFLNLVGNKIEDLSPLETLTKLECLDLKNNQIKNINSLKNLVNLQYLGLGDNSIEDISSLAKLSKLSELHIDRNKIADINAINSLLYLKTLWLNNNKISDVVSLKDLDMLEFMELSDNKITDIEQIKPLLPLPKLKFIGLGSNPVCKTLPSVLGDSSLSGTQKHLKNLREHFGIKPRKITQSEKSTKVKKQYIARFIELSNKENSNPIINNDSYQFDIAAKEFADSLVDELIKKKDKINNVICLINFYIQQTAITPWDAEIFYSGIPKSAFTAYCSHSKKQIPSTVDDDDELSEKLRKKFKINEDDFELNFGELGHGVFCSVYFCELFFSLTKALDKLRENKIPLAPEASIVFREEDEEIFNTFDDNIDMMIENIIEQITKCPSLGGKLADEYVKLCYTDPVKQEWLLSLIKS
jgi:predicted DNA-binding WGR domain protein